MAVLVCGLPISSGCITLLSAVGTVGWWGWPMEALRGISCMLKGKWSVLDLDHSSSVLKLNESHHHGKASLFHSTLEEWITPKYTLGHNG